jgi:hypothetical protein
MAASSAAPTGQPLGFRWVWKRECYSAWHSATRMGLLRDFVRVVRMDSRRERQKELKLVRETAAPMAAGRVDRKAGGKAPARGHWRDLVTEKPRAAVRAHPLDWPMEVSTDFPMATMTAWRTLGATRSHRCIGLWTQFWSPRHHPSRRRNCCLAPGPC